MERIGFIGLGTMGGPMCTNLIHAGYDVTAFDIDADALARQVEVGARPAGSASEAAAQVDILLTSLPRPDHVRSVMHDAGALASLQPGALWIDLTTNSVDLLSQLVAAAPAGVAVVDCPVTGAVDGARNATMTLFLGGDEEPVRRAQTVLEHLGRVLICGPLGTGNVVKLVTNQLWFIHAVALGEGFAVGLANGVELGVLWEAIKDSVGDSFVARHDAPSIFAGHYDPSFTLDLCLKDLGLLERLQANVPASLTLTDAAHEAFARAGEIYGRDVGELHVAKRIEDEADLSFRLEGDWIPHWEG
jgi:3-hydroxyisobutyrate dehydrogenase